jgi:diguanylate cyclase (GGDEF)-like protein/PAS domain S-box-containing protein
VEGGRTLPEVQTEVPLEEATRGILLALLDREGQIAFVNPACRQLFGYEPDEIVGRVSGELVPEPLRDDAIGAFQNALKGESHLGPPTLVRRKDGTHTHLRLDSTPIVDADGAVEYVAISMHELGEASPVARRRVGDEQGAEPELIGRIPAVVYAAEPGAEGRWLYVSPQIEGMLGYTPEEWQAQPGLWAERVHPDDRARVIEEEANDEPRRAPDGTEYRMLTRDGRIIWVRDEAVLRRTADGRRQYDGLLTDITERKQHEAKLQFLAESDSLTGVRNRFRFVVELEAEIKRVRRFRQPASVLMVDVNDLKQVNDTLGHGVGDELLRIVGDTLVRRLRDSDTVARLGGDEFAALLRGAGTEETLTVAKELAATIQARARELAPDVEGAGVSIGVAELRRRFRTADDVLAQADKAMYVAKRGQTGAEAAG